MTAIDEEMGDARARMVREIERLMGELGATTGRGEIAPRTREALLAVPRHLFVPPERLSQAYLNRPVAIGYGQTISQPFIVALMTDLLDLSPAAKVLEIGTGCGYQTAVLARLARQVFTIELCAPLAERAAALMAQIAIGNVTARVGDGHDGWPDEAPFDAIIATAAPHHIPAPLIAQLKGGGRMVIPVGRGRQMLVLVEKGRDGRAALSDVIPVCFVPLTPTADR